jgi:phosphatidylglycerol:prolipoprotein diacylglycerol transferase
MYPVLYELPLPWGMKLPLHGYGFMIVIGFLLACYVSTREARRRGMSDFVYDLGLVMLLSGLFGGRLLYYIENYNDQYASASWLEFFKIWKGGLVFYGGAITGVIGAWLFLRKRKLPLAESFDVVSVGAPIAMAFGRLGCFLNGCCYGKLCDPDFIFGVTFPAKSPVEQSQRFHGLLDGSAASTLPVQPVQLYQAGHDFLLAGLLLWYLRRPDTPRGAGIPLLFTLYGVGRFCLESLRADNAPTFSGLTISQNFSLVLALVFGSVILFLLFNSRKQLRAGEDFHKEIR